MHTIMYTIGQEEQLMDDGNAIANKYYDYSQMTISQLIEQGKYDTHLALCT